MQSSSRSRSFKPGLVGASPITDANLVDGKWLIVDGGRTRAARLPGSINHQLSTINQPRSQSVISSARRFAKAEVRGATPRESASLIYDFGFTIYEFRRSVDTPHGSAIVNRKSQIVNCMPPCLSSYRAGFVNPYSSVRVRPGAPFPIRIVV